MTKASETRRQAIDLLWVRFLEVFARERPNDPRLHQTFPNTCSTEARCNVLRAWTRRLAGWTWGHPDEPDVLGITAPVTPAACEPTDALPGTKAKVLVLKERARKGQNLWHKDDAQHGTPD